MIPDWWWWLLWAWCAAAVLGLLVALGESLYWQSPAGRARLRRMQASRLLAAREAEERER